MAAAVSNPLILGFHTELDMYVVTLAHVAMQDKVASAHIVATSWQLQSATRSY